MSLPTLLSEDAIRPFNYLWDGKVRSGMTSQGQLYALLKCFSEAERAIAYEESCRLATHDVVLTISRSPRIQYRIWIPISSYTDQSLFAATQQGCGCA